MESHLLRLHLAILHVNLITTENDGDVLAHAAKIAMPGRYILICKARSHIEHNNSTLAMNVVTITESTELFLSCCVPTVETDLTAVGGEVERMNLDTNGGCKGEVNKFRYVNNYVLTNNCIV
jgi:hypothetical protein